MPDMHQTLQTLHMLPAQGLLHIGAGLPSPGAWYQQWGLPTIDWIDANEQRHHLLAKHALHHAGEGHRQSHHALLGAACAQAQYYVLSNLQESGLIDAAALTALWPNITTSSAVVLQQSSLDTFAVQNLPHHAKVNWLYIDCLPACTAHCARRQQAIAAHRCHRCPHRCGAAGSHAPAERPRRNAR